jgi:hypothetical protein
MTTKYLLNSVRVGGVAYRPGSAINTLSDDVAGITDAGGVLWPSTDPVVAAAALIAQGLALKGENFDDCQAVMLGSLAASLLSTSSGAAASLIALHDTGGFFSTKTVEGALAALGGGTAGAGQGIVKKTVTITQAADLAGLGAGVKNFDKNLGTALPANARLISVTAETVTDFDDAAHGTYAITVGTSAGGNQVGTSLNVAAGQSGFPKIVTAGAQGYLMAPQGSAQLTVRLASSVDLNTATAGAITLNAFYIVLA